MPEGKLIVTGGPTREWIDPVRFISNPSSGKMGAALFHALAPHFSDAVFIHGPICSSITEGLQGRHTAIESTSDLLDAVFLELTGASLLVMAAAPADYTPAVTSDRKMKKGGTGLSLSLKRTPDILGTIAEERNRGAYPYLKVVGFAAETNDVEQYALDKLHRKKLDMICLNDVSEEGAGFATDTNHIRVYTSDGAMTDFPVASKTEIAADIGNHILTLFFGGA